MKRLVRIADLSLKAGILVLLVFIAGVQLGIRHGRGLQVQEAPAITVAAPPLLRCAQSPETGPVAWTVMDAEAATHAAQQYLATAEVSQVPTVKQAWSTQAAALLQVIALCWGTP